MLAPATAGPVLLVWVYLLFLWLPGSPQTSLEGVIFTQFAAALEKSGSGLTGSGGGSDGDDNGKKGGGDGSGEDQDSESSSKNKDPPNRKKPTPPQKPPGRSAFSDARSAIPLLWSSASKSAANSEEAGNLEDFNAAIGRMFERRMYFHPRFRGALETVNEALARDLLENSSKISATDRQRILYSMGGKGAYLELPNLLLELRQAADHPVEETRRIKNLHRQRRRGVPINREDLKMRPFIPVDFQGPVTTDDIEQGLTEGDMQQRQASVNGWLNMQARARQLHRQHVLHRHASVNKEQVHDDDYEVDDADVLGLSFHGQLSDTEGGDFAQEYSDYIANILGADPQRDDSGESDDATSTTDSAVTGYDD